MYYTLLTSNATNGGTSVISSLVVKLKMPPKKLQIPGHKNCSTENGIKLMKEFEKVQQGSGKQNFGPYET